MIKANLRRQIEIEEDRKAVRKVWGGCLYFCAFPLQELWRQDLQTCIHSVTDRQTAAATERMNQVGLTAVGHQGVIMRHISLSVAARTHLCVDNHDANVVENFSLI